jgi:hypothetical protein
MTQACYLSPLFGAGTQLFTNQGVILAGGSIASFQAGTTTPQPTYTDSTGVTSNGTSVTLDSSGRTTQELWLTAGQPYKFIVYDSNSVQVGPTWDNIGGVNDPGSSSISTAEWTASGLTPTYINSTSFSVTGNQVAKFPVGQRIKYTVSGGTGYGTVQTSTYGSVTTIVIQYDSIALDSGLSVVAYSFLNAGAPSVDAIGVKYDSAITPPASPVSVASLLGRLNYATTLITTTGSGSAYVVTLSPAPTAYATNQPMLIKFSFTTSGSPTMNVNGLGAKNLVQVNAAGAQIPANIVSGQIAEVVYDGTSLVVLANAVSGALLRTTYFTTSGTWTIGTGTNSIEVELVGGGGGVPTNNGSGGGGAGGYARKTIASPSSPVTVTIGAGGVAAADGGTTSFGVVFNATGGHQGNTTGIGGAGGSGSSGDITFNGGAGGWGGAFAADYAFGAGGSSYFGGGAVGSITSGGSISGSNGAANTGGGASGGNISSGNGGSGLCIVREYS